MKTNNKAAALLALFSTGICSQSFAGTQEKQKYNVLYITVDDMRDYVGFLQGYKGVVHTPNMDRLAAMGVGFTNAHASSTVSCPSRNATLTGRRPSSTGLYDNSQWWKAEYPDMVTIPSHFKNNGYYTAGAGKIFHHTPGNNPPCNWDDFQEQVFDDPWVMASWSPESYFLNYGYRGPIIPRPDWKPLNRIQGLGDAMDWGPIPGKQEADYGDVQIVYYANEFFAKKYDKPFFLALGTYKPHIPWHVPQKYFDLYPLDKIVLPDKIDNDLDDVPPIGKKFALTGNDYNIIKNADKLKEAIQGYLACISFADAQVGAILDLLEKSQYKDNTIIVFWSDHGWHFGTKEHWHKRTLWEECTRIPFMFYVPGMTKENSLCDKTVDMVNIFPTLISLCSLPSVEGLDGHDMTPLLKNPNAKWDYPAISELGKGNIAVRSQKWRYILYNDGKEELYDRQKDPNEWNNLANDPKYKQVIEEHKNWVPKFFAEPVSSKETYYFDPYQYTFMNRQTGTFIDGKK